MGSVRDKLKVAAVQMVSGLSLEDNLQAARVLIKEAAQQGAQLVLLPEYFCLMGQHEQDKFHIRETDQGGPIQDALSRMAKDNQLCLIAGTIPMVAEQSHKVRNTVLVYNAQGEQVSRYDKIHLFRFSTDTERYDESNTIEAGCSPIKFELNHTNIGLSVCYDLRFPELYRQLSPIDILVVPAAFTYTTGLAHWELLLRARAVENQCYVLASGQGGVHANGRRTYGHSMWIDPWGKVLNCLPEGQGVVMGEFDPQRLESIRSQLPALEHRVLC